jgi:hypothetical protein
MNIDDTIDAYRTLAPKIFKRKRTMGDWFMMGNKSKRSNSKWERQNWLLEGGSLVKELRRFSARRTVYGNELARARDSEMPDVCLVSNWLPFRAEKLIHLLPDSSTLPPRIRITPNLSTIMRPRRTDVDYTLTDALRAAAVPPTSSKPTAPFLFRHNLIGEVLKEADNL